MSALSSSVAFSPECAWLANLADDDKARLFSLFSYISNAETGGCVWDERQASNDVGLLLDGWAYSYCTLANGTRQVIGVHLPGELLGYGSLFRASGLFTTEMLTAGQYGLVSRAHCLELVSETPPSALSEYFRMVMAAQDKEVLEHLVGLGRRNALQRIAGFIIDMRERTRSAGLSQGECFSMPLTLEQIGDGLGLSSVHVSRVLGYLKRHGIVERKGQQIVILQPRTLATLADDECEVVASCA